MLLTLPPPLLLEELLLMGTLAVTADKPKKQPTIGQLTDQLTSFKIGLTT